MKCNKISKSYVSESAEAVKAINNTTLELEEKGLIFLVGPSGSGKTTLLNVMSGLDCVDEGEIICEDKDLTQMSQLELDEFRRKNIGIVFQNYNLLEEYDVYENIALPLKILGVKKERIHDYVAKALKRVDLEGYEKRKIKELSGGQKQRVAIARAIVKNPQILFLDEPTGNLDEKNTLAVFELIKQISKGCLVVVVTHDNTNAEKFGERIIRIVDGRIDSIDENDGNYRKINKITIKNTKTEQIYLVDKDESIEELVSKLLKGYEEDTVNLKVEISVEQESEISKDVDVTFEELEVGEKADGLKLLDCFRLSLSNFKRQKVRLCITFFLFVFLSLYILLAYTISAFDYKSAMVNYIKLQDIKEIMIYSEKTFVNVFDEDVTIQTGAGEDFFETLSSFIPKENMVKSICIEELFNNENDRWVGSVDAKIFTGENMDYDLLEGTYPTNANEIALSEVLAITFFEDMKEAEMIGKELDTGDSSFVVCGIVKQKQVKEGFNTEENDNGFAILGEAYIESLRECSAVKLEACDITKANALSTYVDGEAWLCSYVQFSEDMLITGRMPEKENEVLISSYLAEEVGLLEDEFVEKTYTLPNLKEERYKNAYDVVNLYDLFPEHQVVVTGIWNSEYENADIAISDKMYQFVVQKYVDYYCYDTISVRTENMKSLMEEFENNQIEIAEEGCHQIRVLNHLLNSLSMMVYLFLVASILIFAFFLISYVSYSVKDRSKEVGIMRSLGIPKKDIISIFSINVILLAATTIPIGIALYSITMNYVNRMYDRRYMCGIGFDVFSGNGVAIFVLELVFLLASYLFALIPILKMSKKTPIDLMKE